MTGLVEYAGGRFCKGLRREKNYREIAEFTCLSEDPRRVVEGIPQGIRHSLRVRFSADRRKPYLSPSAQEQIESGKGSPPPERTLMKIYQVPPASRRPLPGGPTSPRARGGGRYTSRNTNGCIPRLPAPHLDPGRPTG